MLNLIVNCINLIGFLGKDTIIGKDDDGRSFARFTVATSQKCQNKNGEKKEQVEWHHVKAIGKKAEVCAQFLKKGARVFVSGRSQTRSWVEGDKTNYFHEIFLNEIVFLGSKEQNSRKAENGDTDFGNEF